MRRKEKCGRKADIWSSVEYSGFGRALADELSRRGLPTTLQYELTQQEYWNASSWLNRFALRLRAYGIYPAKLWRHLRTSDVRTIPVVSSNTFYAPHLAVLTAAKRLSIVHWVLDLYPDVLTVGGKIATGGAIERVVAASTSFTFRNSAANVFLGRHLLDHALKRYGKINNPHVIPVGADGAPFRLSPPELRRGPVEILYAGNLGLMHEVDSLSALFREPLPLNLRVTLRSNGSGYLRLLRSLGQSALEGVGNRAGTRLILGGSLGVDAWVPAMLAADVALVTLRTGAERVVLPSKTYSAMVAGQAILAVCSRHSDLAEIVDRHECGWIVEPGNLQDLNGLLRHIAANPEEVLRKRRAAFIAGHQKYDQKVVSGLWRDLLLSLPPSFGESGTAFLK